MSVLMRGVDMPKNCEECNFKGECRDYWAKIREAYTRPSWCPLVEVSDLEKPNNCEVECEKCKHFREEADTYMKQCEFYFMECHYEPKTEPKVRSNLEPFRVDEPQKDCAWAAPDEPRTVPLYPMKGGEETNEDNS